MFIDLVVCTYPVSNKKYLYEAPKFSGLEQGDEVIVKDAAGDHAAIVLECETFTKDDEKYCFIVNAMNAELPLARVMSKIVYHKFDWKEDEE